MKYLIILALIFSYYAYSQESLISTEEICNDVEREIKDLELIKKNLKKEFKYKDNELAKFDMLIELTKDVNDIIQKQVLQAKLYHYLDCSRFD